MKKSVLLSYLSFAFISYLSISFYINNYIIDKPISEGMPYSVENNDESAGRFAQELMKLMDPVTKKVPKGIFMQEHEFAKNLPIKSIKTKRKYSNKTQSLTWSERGPNNIGGRTRALGIDVRTGTAPNITIIAGGVSGGIWKSTDDGTSWTLKTAPSQLHNATCVMQDTRSVHQDTWYVGTGEGIGNSANQGIGAYFGGDGIFKSTDNGNTWALLSSTSNGDPNFDSDFDYVSSIAIDPTSGDVYACASSNIYKSEDGGSSWTKKTSNNMTYSYTPGDIQITSNGIIYTAISTFADNGSNANGVRRSSDGGTTWTDISIGVAEFPSVFYRGVLGISPSNPNIVYFLFSYVTSTGVSVNSNQIWKYTYSSGDGSGNGGTWENRGGNLPDEPGGLAGNDPFTTQTGYDMLVQVKPNDENFVILGGTNLYYSTDGFATNTNYNRIGGYAGPSTASKYTNHHPDIHSGAFRPGSNLIYYCGDDGGIQRTDDVTASTVSWNTLNNSFNVTQFFSVSLDPESGSDIILAGAQDNGSLLGLVPGASDWVDISSGDGSMVNIAPIADDRYYPARQSGSLNRVERNGANFKTITPNGSKNQLFINPTILDKNNSHLLYTAAGNSSDNINYYTGIWRNTDATNATTVTGWSFLTSTAIASTGYPRVSALGLSQSNSTNVLYYGTNNGIVKKVTDVSTTASVTNVTSDSFPSEAYVSCIGVDPTNSNKAIVTFSNYNVQSIWFTSDGGTTWIDIEGNLSGSTGPSVRWISIFDVSEITHYFLATSIGIYYTTVLDGSSTVWYQEASSATTIGNVVCDMLDWRSSDNTLAVATHGRGIFTTQISSPLPVELTSFTAFINDGNVVLNWETATEVNNYGFEIERQILTQVQNDNNSWGTIGFVKGHGNSNSTKEYSFVDSDKLVGKVQYRLKQIDINGAFEYSDVVTVELETPLEYKLSQNYPNPFNPSTTISFTLPKQANVKLVVYNSLGEEVVELVNQEMNVGSQSVNFDASNLSSGLYFYKISAGNTSTGSAQGFVDVKKMMLLK